MPATRVGVLTLADVVGVGGVVDPLGLLLLEEPQAAVTAAIPKAKPDVRQRNQVMCLRPTSREPNRNLAGNHALALGSTRGGSDSRVRHDDCG